MNPLTNSPSQDPLSFSPLLSLSSWLSQLADVDHPRTMRFFELIVPADPAIVQDDMIDNIVLDDLTKVETLLRASSLKQPFLCKTHRPGRFCIGQDDRLNTENVEEGELVYNNMEEGELIQDNREDYEFTQADDLDIIEEKGRRSTWWKNFPPLKGPGCGPDTPAPPGWLVAGSCVQDGESGSPGWRARFRFRAGWLAGSHAQDGGNGRGSGWVGWRAPACRVARAGGIH
ncbi:hypothetical protein MA16_Dca022193 [Dendrobium catenatum]|uniref:Uncharacterized protein n=1 Tax=Dendrobium catenatum TaxID=906689 RepID=A0A2I0VGH1_9ASPA|nr:hypothetical protein MA16_Dca022193 [Dendrobium catenatum]